MKMYHFSTHDSELPPQTSFFTTRMLITAAALTATILVICRAESKKKYLLRLGTDANSLAFILLPNRSLMGRRMKAGEYSSHHWLCRLRVQLAAKAETVMQERKPNRLLTHFLSWCVTLEMKLTEMTKRLTLKRRNPVGPFQ